MRIAVYAGTFNPWHKGHEEIVDHASLMFDKIVIAQGFNPMKGNTNELRIPEYMKTKYGREVIVEITTFQGMLVDFLETLPVTAVVKGLRSTIDFEYEKAQQYYNEDLGMPCPVIYLIAGRNVQHISSSAERAIKTFESLKK